MGEPRPGPGSRGWGAKPWAQPRGGNMWPFASAGAEDWDMLHDRLQSVDPVRISRARSHSPRWVAAVASAERPSSGRRVLNGLGR